MLAFPGVERAVVKLHGNGSGQYLCAYYVAHGQPGALLLKEHLSARLPASVIPSFFIQLPGFPFTASGKVDKRRLPPPHAEPADAYAAPRNAVEEALVKTWAQVLEADEGQLGIDDNFFRQGGDSLRGMVLIARLYKQLDIRIPLAVLFEKPTIRLLGGYLGLRKKDNYQAIEPAEARAHYALSPAQRRLYFLNQLEPGSIAYNMPQAVSLKGKVCRQQLEAVFKHLIHRHESLRTSIGVVDEQPVQQIHPLVEFAFAFHDARDGTDQPPAVDELVRQFVRPFDLAQAPLMRAGLIQTADDEHILLIDLHHLVSDGASQAILVRDFWHLYAGKALPPLPLHYKDYAEWQNGRLQQEELRKQEAFWLETFSGGVPVLDLPTDFPRTGDAPSAGQGIGFGLEPALEDALRKLAAAENVTLFALVFALFNVLLSKLSRQEDIVVGTPVSGRRHADAEGIVGLFVNTLALRSAARAGLSFTAFLAETKAGTLAAFEHQEYPYDGLVNKLVKHRDGNRNPLFDVMFAFHNGEVASPAAPGGDVQIKPYRVSNGTTKFDLTLEVVNGKGLQFGLSYKSTLFRETTIRRFIACFKHLVQAVADDPTQLVGQLQLPPDQETAGLAGAGSRVADPYGTGNAKPKREGPEVAYLSSPQTAYVPPQTGLEKAIAAVWQAVLEVERVGVEDNFFEIGGDSMKVVRVVSRLNEHFKVSVNDLFTHQTIGALARNMSEKKDFIKNKLKQFIEGSRSAKTDAGPAPQVPENDAAEKQYLSRAKAAGEMPLDEVNDYRTILLTGGTGYLGGHLLQQLLNKTSARMIVVVRGADQAQAAGKLADKFRYYFNEEVYRAYPGRVEVYPGDLTRPDFGLPPESYQALTANVDCIVNAAANVKHYGNYQLFKEANVTLVEQLIRFAATGVRKDIHHISTVSVGSGKVEGQPSVLFTEYDCDVNQQIENFYVRTKLEAEKLLIQARGNAISTSIYRVANLVFDSQTGVFQENIENNSFYSRIRSFIRLGYIPRYEKEFELSFVDQAAEAVVTLFNRKQLADQTHHLLNPNTLPVDAFQGYLSRLGYSLEAVDAAEFAKFMLEEYDNEREEMDNLLLRYRIFDEEGPVSNFRLRADKSQLILKSLGFYWKRADEGSIGLMLAHCEKVNFIGADVKKMPAKDKPMLMRRNKPVIREMQYRSMGRSGLKLSALSLGSWLTFGNKISNDMATKLMTVAYDNGVNFFDNAEVYAQGRAEVVMGSIIRKLGWKRDTYVLSSKVFWGGKKPNQFGLSRKHVLEACHASLGRMQTDYLDLYLCHRPDPDTPLEETVRAMHDLVHQGKVLYWGTSEWSAQQIREAHAIARSCHLVPPSVEQPQYNMFTRQKVEDEFESLYGEIGLGITSWAPLYAGILTGKYNPGSYAATARLNAANVDSLNDESGGGMLQKVEAIRLIAGELGTTTPRLAIAWCLKNPHVSSVLLGATRLEQLEENLQALEVSERLTAGVMGEIEVILAGSRKVAGYGVT
ncbi:MAG: aldo/keto reductase [Cytophagales bacterium]|nr:aldo/keto reductase [Cytophagales bacterium]